MQYEFEYIEALLSEVRSKKNLSTAYSRMRMEELESKRAEVQSRLIVNACSAISNNGIRHYIRIHYSALNRLIDSFSPDVKQPSASDSAQKKLILEHLYGHCLEYRDFIITNFPSYLSNWSISPENIAAEEKAKILAQIRQLDLESSNVLSLTLQAIWIESLSEEHQSWYLSSAAQWKALIENLGKINPLTGENFEETILVLIRQNYNSPAAYDEICRWISTKLPTMISPLEQQQYLAHLKNIFQQASAFCGKRFYKNHKSLGQKLLKYIKAERKQIDLEIDTTRKGATPYPSQGNFTVSLSVKQLAFFAFLQVETGIILSQTAKQVHQHFTSRFSTMEGGTISEKSFKNAYYSHSPADIMKVIDKLSQMLALAEESY